MHVLEASAISLSRYVLGEMLRLRWFSEAVRLTQSSGVPYTDGIGGSWNRVTPGRGNLASQSRNDLLWMEGYYTPSWSVQLMEQ